MRREIRERKRKLPIEKRKEMRGRKRKATQIREKTYGGNKAEGSGGMEVLVEGETDKQSGKEGEKGVMGSRIRSVPREEKSINK